MNSLQISDEGETHPIEEVYETVTRPNLSTESRNVYNQPPPPQSDSSDSSDSDIVSRVKKIQPRFQMMYDMLFNLQKK